MQLVPLEVSPVEDVGAEITDAEGAAMARAVVRLFGLWGITDQQACILLGGLAKRTYARWKTGDISRLSIDQKTRLSALMGIHKALRILFVDKHRAYGWIKAPNETFGGRSALDIMLRGYMTDILRIRGFLDAARG